PRGARCKSTGAFGEINEPLVASPGQTLCTPLKEVWTMSATKDKVKGKVNEVVGKAKQASDKPSTKAEGRMQERKGEAQQVKGKSYSALNAQVDYTLSLSA